jgi:hypothetical protein
MAKIGSDVIGKGYWTGETRSLEAKTYFIKTETRHGIQGHIVVSTKNKEGEEELAVKGTMKQVIRRANAYLVKKGKEPVSSVEIEGEKMLFSPKLWFM